MSNYKSAEKYLEQVIEDNNKVVETILSVIAPKSGGITFGDYESNRLKFANARSAAAHTAKEILRNPFMENREGVIRHLQLLINEEFNRKNADMLGISVYEAVLQKLSEND